MREGPAARVVMKIERCVLLIVVTLSLAGGIHAQGGDGRSGTVDSRGSTATHRNIRRAKPLRRPIERDTEPVIQTGRLSIVVNEGGSRLFLSRPETGFETELATAASSAPSLIVRTLPAGTYKLLAKKQGYFDETRSVDIHPDKRRKVVVNLRPQMALLTVNTNLADSEIDVAGLGKFTGSIKKEFVRPGTYKVAVQRRGYVSQIATVELKAAGREQNLSIVLQPLRIDSVLALASEKLDRGDFTTAFALTNDVLLLNPHHAKANLLYGEISYERGDISSTSYFMKAIRNGETLFLPVKILEGAKLIDVVLRINRETLGIRSAARVDLNYDIARQDITEFGRSLDPVFLNHITIKGKSDFHGRAIEPHMSIYPRIAAMKTDTQTPYCNAPSSVIAAGRSCVTDIDIIHKLIAEWLEMKEAAGSSH